jgi:hypothetical protein
MTSQSTDSAVRTAVVVSASQEHAFSVFTEGIGTWEQMRDAVASPDGWQSGLARFAERAAVPRVILVRRAQDSGTALEEDDDDQGTWL